MGFSKKHFFQILVLLFLFFKISETTKRITSVENQEIKIIQVDFEDVEKEKNEEKEAEENYKINHTSEPISLDISLNIRVKKEEINTDYSIYLDFIQPPPNLIFS